MPLNDATCRNAPSHYIPTLDGWRALSALAIILYHSTPKDTNALISQGQKGVHVFFAISGFLITARLLAETRAEGSLSLRRFYTRRFFRIVPPAYAFLALITALWFSGLVSLHPAELAAALAFVRNFFPTGQAGGWYTAHYWSLGVEEQFYLAWPLLLAWGARPAQVASLAIAAFVGVWRATNHHFGWVSQPGIAVPAYDYIMWGCWWALFVESPQRRERVRRVLTTSVWIAVLALACAVSWWIPPGASSLLAMLIPVVLLGTILRPDSAASRVLELGPLRWIGRVSYGLYLWQQLFCVNYLAPPVLAIQRFPSNILALFCVTAASYYWLERPLMALGHRLAPSMLDPDTGSRPVPS